MSETKTKEKDSNELLNWLLIIIGLLYVVQAVMQFLAWAGLPIAVPAWLTEAASVQLFWRARRTRASRRCQRGA